VDPDGVVHFDKEVVPDGDVMPRLIALAKGNPNLKLFISADREALHGEVMKLLDRVRSAGIEKVAYEIKIKHGAAGAPGAPAAPGVPGVPGAAGAPVAPGSAPPPPPPPPAPTP
jgi:hypothetical protein